MGFSCTNGKVTRAADLPEQPAAKRQTGRDDFILQGDGGKSKSKRGNDAKCIKLQKKCKIIHFRGCNSQMPVLKCVPSINKVQLRRAISL